MVQFADENGNVVYEYAYDAFGVEDEPDSHDTNPFRYCGEYFDRESGKYYLRARYYDPKSGRFTQEDTHWNPKNMIYGDDPVKINEREDRLGLKHYAYAPDRLSVMQSGNLYGYCDENPVAYIDKSGKFLHIAIGAITGAVLSGALNVFSQLINTGHVDFVEVLISVAGGAVGGALTAAGFGALAAGVTSGLTNLATQLYKNELDFRKIDVGSILIDAALGALGAKIGCDAGNTAHLDKMGENLLKRIGNVLSGKVFKTDAALKSACEEIAKALKYYASQAKFDDKKVFAAVIKSCIPFLVKLGYDVYELLGIEN